MVMGECVGEAAHSRTNRVGEDEQPAVSWEKWKRRPRRLKCNLYRRASTRSAKGMPQTIRFHLDEHCPTGLADGLRRRGIDVTTTPEAGLLHASDEEHVAFALRQGRVVFTQDEDFLILTRPAGGMRG